MMRPLPTLPDDRRCRAGTLDNVLRRRLAPARREVDRLDPRAGQTVADLGTGVGFYLPELAGRVGPTGIVWAVDPDPGNLERARARSRELPQVRFLEQSAADRSAIPDGSVDRVLLSLVLCCLVDKAGVLEEGWRILRPGGRLLATYPRGMWFGSRRRDLRVSGERWAGLVARRPWERIPTPAGWLIVRHLLGRPNRAPNPPT